MSTIAVAALALAAQAAPAQLPPAGKWVVEYNEGDCTMSRAFGDPAAPTTFGFQPSPTGSLGEVILLMPASGTKGGVPRGKGAAVLQPSGRRFDALWAMGPLPDGRRGLRFSAEEGFWDALPAATALTMDLSGQPPFTVGLGPMAAPLAAVKTCSDDLLRSWGAEPGATAKFRRGNNPVRYFSVESYPKDAIRAREQGRSVPLLTIDPTGRVNDCRIVRKASATLDAETCRILVKNARFEEAGPDGPARRWAVVPVRWMLPD